MLLKFSDIRVKVLGYFTTPHGGQVEILGHNQVQDLPIIQNGREVRVHLAGVVLIDTLEPLREIPISVDGEILAIDDVTIHGATVPNVLPVSGVAKLDTVSDEFTFTGSFHATGYVHKAVEALMDSVYSGDQEF